MGGVFHGWRRKLGVLTLVIAIAAVCGWVRSFTITDTMTDSKDLSQRFLGARNGTIELQRFTISPLTGRDAESSAAIGNTLLQIAIERGSFVNGGLVVIKSTTGLDGFVDVSIPVEPREADGLAFGIAELFPPSIRPAFQWTTSEEKTPRRDIFGRLPIVSNRRFCGIGYVLRSLTYKFTDIRNGSNPIVSVEVITVPYWSIVIPLTLISAFLLLTKPRKSTHKKIDVPGPERRFESWATSFVDGEEKSVS